MSTDDTRIQATRLLIAASTGGSVLRRALSVPAFRHRVCAVVADRVCGALEVAQEHAIPTHLLATDDALEFSDFVLDVAKQLNVGAAISFYLRLFRGQILSQMRNRIINLHPSLLPAFSGFHAFERSIAAGVRFIGNTVHFIDQSVDGGPIIAQSMLACGGHHDPSHLRHMLFAQQCQLLIQISSWLAAGRLMISDGKVIVENADYSDTQFSPALDDPEALTLAVPLSPLAGRSH